MKTFAAVGLGWHREDAMRGAGAVVDVGGRYGGRDNNEGHWQDACYSDDGDNDNDQYWLYAAGRRRAAASGVGTRVCAAGKVT